MTKDHKLFFYDRCGQTRDAIRGKKTTTRIILGCDPDTPIQAVPGFAPTFTIGEVVPIMMSYKNLLHFNRKTLDFLLVKENGAFRKWKPEYRKEIKGKGWEDKYCALPELMLFHAEILDTKIQHLQEITDDEIRTEGIMFLDDGRAAFNDTTKEFCQAQIFGSPREAYKAFIDLSEGEYIWEYDPWALVVEFKVVDADKYEVL